jgi:hypothetical protein
MRTDSEIVTRVRERIVTDIFGSKTIDLIAVLPFGSAKQFLKEGIGPERWAAEPRDRDAVLARILAYLPFAWSKANQCRGLSAARSLEHLSAWLWLIGEDEAPAAIENYTFHGKPQLRALSEAVGFDWRAIDDGYWRAHPLHVARAPEAVPAVDLKLTQSLVPRDVEVPA